jgi:hypothetical protein
MKTYGEVETQLLAILTLATSRVVALFSGHFIPGEI